MYRFHDARTGFVQIWYGCSFRLWKDRIKIVSVGA